MSIAARACSSAASTDTSRLMSGWISSAELPIIRQPMSAG